MKPQSLVCVTALAALLLAGCDRRKQEPPPPPEPQSASRATDVTHAADGTSHLPPGIEWFDGDVDAAFAAAKAANKPVFLYWDAEW